MGLGGISAWQLLILAFIIMLLFGTNRIKDFGQDLGASLRGFRDGMKDIEEEAKEIKKELDKG